MQNNNILNVTQHIKETYLEICFRVEKQISKVMKCKNDDDKHAMSKVIYS